MIKIIINLAKIVLVICFTLLFSGCVTDFNLNTKSITGNGNINSTIRNVENFDKIQVSKGLDCEVEQGINKKVQVIADENLINGITTKVENGILVISSDYNRYKNVKSKKIKVTAPNINSLEVSSGARLITTSVLKGKSIFIKTSSAGNVNANLNFEQVIAQSSSGSNQLLAGLTLDLQSQSSSGSNLNAKLLKANTVNTQSSSGSISTIYPIEILTANASSGSNIVYVHTPKNITKEASSGGSVQKE